MYNSYIYIYTHTHNDVKLCDAESKFNDIIVKKGCLHYSFKHFTTENI